MNKLNVIIAQGGKKREIKGAFEICVDRYSLELILDALQDQKDDHSYGWIVIREYEQISTPNTTAIPWDQD